LEDKGEKYTLQVKLSDPAKKDTRHGALHEGREVYIKNLNWAASEEDVKEYFGKAGTVESVRIPRHMNGKSKGFAFVVFETAAEAEAAIEKFRNGSIKGRPFNIEISQPKEQRTATTIHLESTPSGAAGSPAASAAASAMSPEAADPESNESGKNKAGEEVQETGKTVRERTLALMNVPDVVTTARIEKLLEPYGIIKKLTLRPDHAGAIVEFVEEKSVHSANLSLSGTEIDGSVIRTGTVKELLEQQPMKREMRLDQKKSNAPKKAATMNPFANSMIRRPGDKQKLLGAKRRGGLGTMKSGFGRGASSAANNSDGAAKSVFKTNEDFRAMFLGAKKSDSAGEDSKKREEQETRAAEAQQDEEAEDNLDDLMDDDDEEYEDEGVDGAYGDVNGGEEAMDA